MHEYCFVFDGIRRRDEVSVPANTWFSSAGLYGLGIFTTTRVRGGRPTFWQKHWSRLNDNAAKLNLDISGFAESFLLRTVERLIEANEVDTGLVRLTILAASDAPLFGDRSTGRPMLLIHSRDLRPKPEKRSVTLSPYQLNSNSPLAGVKSCNYAEQLIAYEAATRKCFDEAIRLNEKGHVTSACMANVFWEAGGKLYTPSLSTGCLAGTTREFVMESLECDEVEAGVHALGSADRIFLTSAGLGVVPVDEFERRRLDTSDHPILRLIRE